MAVLTLARSVYESVSLFCVQAPKPVGTVPQFFVEWPKHFNNLNHVKPPFANGHTKAQRGASRINPLGFLYSLITMPHCLPAGRMSHMEKCLINQHRDSFMVILGEFWKSKAPNQQFQNLLAWLSNTFAPPLPVDELLLLVLCFCSACGRSAILLKAFNLFESCITATLPLGKNLKKMCSSSLLSLFDR